ncbi:MAG: MFS transporter [Candidatus Omnitrophica bacterium]|nr:MFS transporter [Candidatus Omnitrophota bacterium]
MKNRNFLLLWLGQIVSQFGDRLNQMALIALVSARAPGSTFQLAKVLSFTILPIFFVGPIAASYVDRWDRRRTMMFCDLLRCALVALIACYFIHSRALAPIYIIIFLIFSAGRFFVPAKLAIIPQLVSEEKLLMANSLSVTTGMIAAVAGFGLGGLLVEEAGPAQGFLIDAATYFISALLIFLISAKAIKSVRANRQGSPDAPRLFKKSLLFDIKEGWQHLGQDSQMRFLARLVFLLGSALGAVSVVIVVFVQTSLGSVTKDLGVLAMCLGLGLFVGSLIYGRFGQKTSRIKMIFISLVAAGIALSLFTVCLELFASSLFACCLALVLGLTVAPIIISVQTMVHELTQDRMRGRIFGSLDIVAYLAFFLFMFLSAFLAEKISRFWILLTVGIVLTASGTAAILLRLDKKRAINA